MMTLRSSLAIAALAVVLFGVVFPASAQQRVGMLAPVPGDASPENAEAVATRIIAGFEAAGWTVVPSDELSAQARRARNRCEQIDCAAALARAVSLEWIGQIRLWTAPDGSVRQIVIALVSPDGLTREGSADVNDDEPAEASDRAVASVLRRVAGEDDPVNCAIHGTPVGATVVIDGQPAGVLPWSGALTPGMHEVVVSRAGYETARRQFQVSSGARITFELRETRHVDVGVGSDGDAVGGASESGGATLPPPVVAQRVRPWYSWAGPLALVAGGLAFVGLDVAALAGQRCDVRGASGRCLDEQSIDEVPFAVFGAVGVAMLTGAIVWFVLGEEEVPIEPTARVGLGVGSLALEGTF